MSDPLEKEAAKLAEIWGPTRTIALRSIYAVLHSHKLGKSTKDLVDNLPEICYLLFSYLADVVLIRLEINYKSIKAISADSVKRKLLKLDSYDNLDDFDVEEDLIKQVRVHCKKRYFEDLEKTLNEPNTSTSEE